jgi:hypothetical protein
MGRGEASLISPQRMVGWDFHQDDSHSVRIRDPHLYQSPRLLPRLAEYWYTGVKQPPVLTSHVPDLNPDRHRIARRMRRPSADFEKTVTQEKDEAGSIPAAELSVDRQSQHVPVKPVTPTQLSGMQQNSAAENLHSTHHRVAKSEETACTAAVRVFTPSLSKIDRR